jgi:translation initiation factor eIF-2B subunit epsilon
MQKFRPVSDEVPKALLPVVNAPMMEYALEWLASNGVEKVFVLCCAHADEVVEYLHSSSKWAPDRSAMEIQAITNYGCRSAGEALRFIDQEGLIQDDFVLLSCDSFTNMELSSALTAHRQRRCVRWQLSTNIHPQETFILNKHASSIADLWHASPFKLRKSVAWWWTKMT